MKVSGYIVATLVAFSAASAGTYYTIDRANRSVEDALRRQQEFQRQHGDVAQLQQDAAHWLIVNDLVFGSGVTYLAEGAMGISTRMLAVIESQLSRGVEADVRQEMVLLRNVINKQTLRLSEVDAKLAQLPSKEMRREALNKMLAAMDRDLAAITGLLDGADRAAHSAIQDIEATVILRVQQRDRITAGLLVGLLLFALGLWWWLTASLTRPIQKLVQLALQSETGGTFAEQLGPQEIRELAKAFAGLAPPLEDRVEARTIELSNMNVSLRSARKDLLKSQQRLENMALFPEQNPNPVLEVSSDYVLSYVNPGGRSQLPGLAVGERISELLVDVLQQRHSAEDEGHGTFRCGHFQYHGRWYQAGIAELVGGELRIYLSDLTAQKETAGLLEVARDRAERANRAKTEFLANMSHELRTPMNGVIGLTQVLSNSSLDPGQRECVETIQRSGGNLLAIIDDILDLSKLESGHVSVLKNPFDLRSTCEDVIDALATRAGASVTVGMVYHATASPTVIGDLQRTQQVLTNLLGNALKFTSSGQAAIRVRQQGDSVLVEVTDTGIGIPEARLDAIFRPFEQADNSTSRQFGGTGLGLAISQRYVEAMGSHIKAQSKVGAGSTFSFSLPAAAMVSQQLGPLSKYRALVIETCPLTIESLTEALHSLNTEVVVANSVEDAARLKNREEDGYFHLAFICEEQVNAGSRAALLEQGIHYRELCCLTSKLASARPTMSEPVRQWLVKPIRMRVLARIVSRRQDAEMDRKPQSAQGCATKELGLRILLAEDNRVNQMVAKRMLKLLGCQVVVAHNGAEAVQRHDEEAFDVILMDCQMPVMDGFAATVEIRAHATRAGTPIVALTANAMAHDREACRAVGMDGFLAKPLVLKRLIEVLGAYTLQCIPEAS